MVFYSPASGCALLFGSFLLLAGITLPRVQRIWEVAVGDRCEVLDRYVMRRRFLRVMPGGSHPESHPEVARTYPLRRRVCRTAARSLIAGIGRIDCERPPEQVDRRNKARFGLTVTGPAMHGLRSIRFDLCQNGAGKKLIVGGAVMLVAWIWSISSTARSSRDLAGGCRGDSSAVSATPRRRPLSQRHAPAARCS